jgi:hypothetical protein
MSAASRPGRGGDSWRRLKDMGAQKLDQPGARRPGSSLWPKAPSFDEDGLLGRDEEDVLQHRVSE